MATVPTNIENNEQPRRGNKRPISPTISQTDNDSQSKRATLSRNALGDISNNQQNGDQARRTTSQAENDGRRGRGVAMTASGNVLQVVDQADVADVSTLLAEVVDVDANDHDNPLMVTEYAKEIFENMKAKEVEFYPVPGYMENGLQRDINTTMRGILVDWLVEVAEEYQLLSETLHLAVVLMDRFLAVVPVLRGRLQLVGITCMLLASKYEEIYSPAVSDYVYITDSTYTREELLKMEGTILSNLHFDLTVPTIKNFLRRWVKCAEADGPTTKYSSYLAELCLLDYSMIEFRPSMVSAAAVMIARATFGHSPAWTETLAHNTGYRAEDLREVVLRLHASAVASRAGTLTAVRDKYAHEDFDRSSATAPVIPKEFNASE